MDVYIGLDVGTTSTKAVAFNRNGKSCGEHTVAYPILSEVAGWAEQEPEAILSAVLECLGQVLKQMRESGNRVAAVGLSTAMHAVLAMDENDQYLTRFIIWADNRSVEQAARLADSGIGYEVYRRTGTQIHAMSPLPKLVWLREQQPDVFRRASKFMSLKDYLAYRLFGQFVIDYSVASATGLFRLDRLDWDDEALALAGVERDRLPALKPTTYVLTGMRPAYAEAIGLTPGKVPPVILGASDGVLANLGSGAIDPGEVAVTIGTSGAVRTIIDRPITDERQRTFCYALAERHWVIGGANNNGAIVLQWLRSLLTPDGRGPDGGLNRKDADRLLAGAERIAAGSKGLLFLPFLSGERAPVWDPNARGILFGLSLAHGQDHLVRATMEGMMLSIRSILQAIEETRQRIIDTAINDPQRSNSVKAMDASQHRLPAESMESTLVKRSEPIGLDYVLVSGGFAKSAFLRQLLSDVLGKKVRVPSSYEASSFGAAVLAMFALGEIGELAEVKQMIEIQEEHTPNVRNNSMYNELMPIYEQLYQDLKPRFVQMANVQSKVDEGLV